jgi:hypothetical protein
MFATMGMSAFKLFLILGAVGILLLPTLIRRSSALPTIFEQLRSRIAGEDPAQDKSAEASPATINQEATKPSMAERFGGMLARVNSRIRPKNR